MRPIAIEAENLSKAYRIAGQRRESYRTLRETLTDAATGPFRRVGRLLRGELSGAADLDETFWALKDVSFRVDRGEALGIIGRNGAGKSTLLKLLSRITEPTRGFADIHGRVGSLLEVGTGFHPELTGRENVILNGAILGMKRSEIEKKYDDIVSFAEVEKFMDTPLKHYSSGMYLRLAFAVAAHLEPEILLVDEVLAVGDAAFQQKCLGRMGQVTNEGRTVLFVSHNMEAMLNLCSRCIVLIDGEIAFSGPADRAVGFYYSTFSAGENRNPPNVIYSESSRPGLLETRIRKIEILDRDGRGMDAPATWDDVVFRVHYTAAADFEHGSVILDVRDGRDQRRLIVVDSGLKVPIRGGDHVLDCLIRRFPLSAGEYHVGGGISHSRSYWLWRELHLGSLRVHGKDVFGIGRPPVSSRMVVAVEHEWLTPDSSPSGSPAEPPAEEKAAGGPSSRPGHSVSS